MANIAITFVETHDETKPAGTRARSLGDDDIRELKRAFRERLAIDHQFQADESGNAKIGTHKKLTFTETQGNDPTAYDDVGYLYIKAVSGIKELFWMDSAGQVIQLTSAGVINDTVLAKTGDWMQSSVATARAGWTNVSATYSNKFIRINATPLTLSGSDTHVHGVGTYAATIPNHAHNFAVDPVLQGNGDSACFVNGGQVWGNEGSGTAGALLLDNTQTDGGGGGCTLSGESASVSNVPAYVQAVLFQKD